MHDGGYICLDCAYRWARLQVYFERTFCLSCFWKKHNMRAPTAYVAHFAAVPCCGEYSLEKVIPVVDWPVPSGCSCCERHQCADTHVAQVAT